MRRPKNKALRWLRRNCIRIPCVILVAGTLITVNRWAYGVPEQEKPPVTNEVFAAVEIPDTPVKVAVTAEKEPETNCIGSVEEMIQVACEYYGIDHAIPLAIAKLETGHFTSAAYLQGNNVGGMSVNEVPMTFDSLTEGVDAFVKNLTDNYFALGMDTPEEIGSKYCPVNPEWANVVSQLMGGVE